MFEKAKVGDEVFDLRYGKGYIEDTHNEPDMWPLLVIFKGKARESYLFDGRVDKSDDCPMLYWAEPEITPPPRPKRKVKKEKVFYMNIYSDGLICGHYNTRHEADTYQKKGSLMHRLGEAHKIVHPYEVDE